MILVTGGTGFVGAKLIELLTRSGKKIRAVKRSSSEIPEILTDNSLVEWVTADLLDLFQLEAAFQGVREIYHCAAQVSYDPSTRKSMMETNVRGTAHLVNLSLEYKLRMVHVSSIAAIGKAKAPEQLITEDDIWQYSPKQSPYAISKFESEMEVWRGIAEGLDAVIINPSLIIGASAGSKGSGAVFHLLAKGLKFYTGGSVGVVDVEDVAKAMITLMDRRDISGERFIVNHQNLTHKELLTLASVHLGRKPPQICATPFILGIGWRLALLQSRLTKKKPTLTKSSAAASLQKLRYSNKKLVGATGFTFKPLEKTLEEICIPLKNNY